MNFRNGSFPNLFLCWRQILKVQPIWGEIIGSCSSQCFEYCKGNISQNGRISENEETFSSLTTVLLLPTGVLVAIYGHLLLLVRAPQLGSAIPNRIGWLGQIIFHELVHLATWVGPKNLESACNWPVENSFRGEALWWLKRGGASSFGNQLPYWIVVGVMVEGESMLLEGEVEKSGIQLCCARSWLVYGPLDQRWLS